MKMREKLAPVCSVLRKTASLWIWYGLIPVVLLVCWGIRHFLAPELPAAVAIILIDVLLLILVRKECTIWQRQKEMFTPQEQALLMPLFLLIPVQIVFIIISALIVLP